MTREEALTAAAAVYVDAKIRIETERALAATTTSGAPVAFPSASPAGAPEHAGGVAA
jgi:hypothetical protein